MTSTEYRIFGPPGTGKTTTISGLVTQACQEYGSEAVLAASFTRTAARELVRRDLPMNDDQIGTLHALCFRALDRPKILSGAQLKDWNAEHPAFACEGGGTVDLDDPYAGGDGATTKDGDRLLQDYHRLRGLMIPKEEWPVRVQWFADAWQDFKANTGTVDFTDLIETCWREQAPIPHAAQVFFLDEVQDFSPLELALARMWGSQCETVYLAGDDDQCLYRFKGAVPDTFLSPTLPAEQVRVLAQSYRIPRAVHDVATRWIGGVTARMPKDYQPRKVEGVEDVVPITSQYVLPIKPLLDEWLAEGKRVAFLASCAFFLDPLKRQLREWGVPFHNPYRKQRGDWNPLGVRAGTVSAAERLLAFRQVADRGQWWTYADLWKWVAMLEAEGVCARGAKTALRRKAEDEANGKTAVLAEDLDAWLPAPETADAASRGDVAWLLGHLLSTYQKPMGYAGAVLQAYGAAGLQSAPLVSIGTIHSYKGGEADHVVLFPDLSPSGYREWTTPGEAQDSVRRMFYVGMTRAREGLHWAQPCGLSIGGYR
jgi:DNA helicase-2/ATP-dependent DNA helicase PcrA